MKKIYFRLFLSMLLLISLVMSGCLSGSRWGSEPASDIMLEGKFGLKQEFNPEEADLISGQLLVRLKPGADPGKVFQAVGGKEIQSYEELGWYLITYGPDHNHITAEQQLLQTGQVYYAEPNRRVRTCSEPVEPPNDPIFYLQWGLREIKALYGWKETTGSEGVIIAVLDTGIDHTHPDLSGKVVAGCDFTKGIPGGVPGLPGDDGSHGTHVAGIAAAETDNGIGVAGVAPACRLMAVKVLRADGGGDWADVADGIRWAADNGADVINLSLSGSFYSRFVQEAVEYALEKNVPVVAAAGNRHKYYDNAYPAAFPGVISVGAVKSDKTKTDFSTKGSHVFLAAPGQGIYSTVPPVTTGKEYDSYKGTSMATPFVSGAIALLKAKWSELDINGIHAQLKKTVEDLATSGWDPETGWGLLDLGAALAGDEPLENDLFGTLEVNVVDKDGKSVPYAKVFLAGENRKLGTMTYEDGKVLFMAQPAGNYTIEASKDGLRCKVEATITAGQSSPVTITLAATGE